MTKLLDWIAHRLALWFTASALLALGCMWLISANYRAPAGEEQPKVTDWMQAWGGVFGVVAGLAAAGAAAALLLHERRRSEKAEQQLAEERAEAVLNIPRSVVVTIPRFGGHGPRGNQTITQVTFTVNNYGGAVLRNVAIIVDVPQVELRLALPRRSAIGPGVEERISHNVPVHDGVDLPGEEDMGVVRVIARVCFIDPTSQAWEITSDGEVSRTTVPYPAAEKALNFPRQ